MYLLTKYFLSVPQIPGGEIIEVKELHNVEYKYWVIFWNSESSVSP